MAKTTQQDLMENPYVTNAILECVLSISKIMYLLEKGDKKEEKTETKHLADCLENLEFMLRVESLCNKDNIKEIDEKINFAISKNYDFYYLMEAYYSATEIIRESFYL